MNRCVDGLGHYVEPERARWALEISFSFACWILFCSMTILTGQLPLPKAVGYQFGYQSVYVEFGGPKYGKSHGVSWHYMTHPSLFSYILLWIGEAGLFVLPGITVALAMVYLPWHFQTMGSACFGIYVTHVSVAFSDPIMRAQSEIIKNITNPSWDQRLNFLILLLWTILLCLVYAHTIGVLAHRLLVWTLQHLAKLLSSDRSNRLDY